MEAKCKPINKKSLALRSPTNKKTSRLDEKKIYSRKYQGILSNLKKKTVIVVAGASAEESEDPSNPDESGEPEQTGNSPGRLHDDDGGSHESAETDSPDTAALLQQAREADILSKYKLHLYINCFTQNAGRNRQGAHPTAWGMTAHRINQQKPTHQTPPRYYNRPGKHVLSK